MTASSRKRAKRRYPEGALQEAGMQRPQRPGAISVWTRTLHSIPATSVKLVANRKVHPYCGDAGRVPGKVSEGSRSVSKAFLSHHEVPTRILTPRPRMMSCGFGGPGYGLPPFDARSAGTRPRLRTRDTQIPQGTSSPVVPGHSSYSDLSTGTSPRSALGRASSRCGPARFQHDAVTSSSRTPF